MRSIRIAVFVAAGISAVAVPAAYAAQPAKKPAVVQAHKPPVVNVTLRSPYTPYQIEYRVGRILNGYFVHDHNLHVTLSRRSHVAATVQDCHVPGTPSFPDVSRWFDFQAWDIKITACQLDVGKTNGDLTHPVFYPVQSTQVTGHDFITTASARSDYRYFWRKAWSYIIRKFRVAGRADKSKHHHRVSVPTRHLRNFDGATGRIVLNYSGCSGWQAHPGRAKRRSAIVYDAGYVLTVVHCDGTKTLYPHRYI